MVYSVDSNYDKFSLEDKQDERKNSWSEMVDSVVRTGVTGGNYLIDTLRNHRDTGKFGFEKDSNFDLNSVEARELLKDIPADKQYEMYDAESIDELKFNVNLYKNSDDAKKILHEELGTVGTFAAVMAAGIIDPLTYVGYGAVGRFNSASKLYQQSSNLSKSAVIGIEAGLIEGASVAEIEYHGTKDYINVPITAAAGFLLAGGISHAASILEKSSIRSIEKSETELMDNLSGGNPANNSDFNINAALMADIDYRGAKPIRSKVVELLDIATGGKLPLFASPMRVAANRGGSVLAEAAKFDLHMYRVADKNGKEINFAENKNAMDHWYDIRKDYYNAKGQLRDIYREFNKNNIEAGNKPISQEMFDREVIKEYNDFGMQYKAKKEEIKQEIIETRYDEVIENVEAKMITKIREDDIASGIKELDEESIASRAKKEIEDNPELARYELEKLAAEDDMLSKFKDELKSKDSNMQKGIDALQQYYSKMSDNIVDAKMSEYLDPSFYSPVEWNPEVIRLHDKKEVMSDIAESIMASPEYKIQMNAIEKRIRELAGEYNTASKLNNQNIDKEIDMLQDELFKLQHKDDAIADVLNGELDVAELNKMFYKNEGIRDLKQEDLDILFGKTNKNLTIAEELEPSLLNLIAKSDFEEINQLWLLAGKPKISVSPKAKDRAGRYVYNDKVKHNIFLNKGLLSDRDRAAKTLKHELIHASLDVKYRTDATFKNNIDDIFEQAKKEYGEYIKDDNDTYFLFSSEEMLAEAFSNPNAAKKLNELQYSSGNVNKKGESLWDRLIELILNVIPVKSGSALEAINANVKSASRGTIKVGKKTKELRQLRKNLDKARQDGAKTKIEKAQNDIDNFIFSSYKAKNGKIIDLKISEVNGKLEKVMQTKLDELKKIETKTHFQGKLKEAVLEKRKLKKSAYIKAQNTVNKMNGFKEELEISTKDSMSASPSVLKKRTLNVNPNHEKIQKYLLPKENSLDRYHYKTAGRIATAKSTGHSKLADYRDEIEARPDLDKDDVKLLLDMFEDVQGTRILSKNPDSLHNHILRGATSFNYVTMGGQFGMYGVSEIAVPLYRLGFGYMREMVPALDETIKLYRGKNSSKLYKQSLDLTHTHDILEYNSAKNRFGDTSSPDELMKGGALTFRAKTVDALSSMSRGMFRYSGLEGITTITRAGIPRAFMRKILDQYAIDPKSVTSDMRRFGLSDDALKDISSQPVIRRQDGEIEDFNFENWDKKVLDRFETVTQRMTRETIIHVDPTRLPAWFNDSGVWLLLKLAKQFMSFSMVSHERLLLAGMADRPAMVAAGSLTSAMILGTFQVLSEEIGTSAGLIKERDRRFNIEKQDGLNNLGEYMFTRHSYSGNVGQIYDFVSEVSQPSKSYAATTKFAGGITAGRIVNASRAVVDAAEGKLGTRNQASTIKSMVPYNNIILMDNLNKHLFKEAIQKGY